VPRQFVQGAAIKTGLANWGGEGVVRLPGGGSQAGTERESEGERDVRRQFERAVYIKGRQATRKRLLMLLAGLHVITTDTNHYGGNREGRRSRGLWSRQDKHRYNGWASKVIAP
jgi:hypothetical protein